jgi:predicted ATPase
VPGHGTVPHGEAPEEQPLSSEAVREQLARILRSNALANAPSLSRFLSFIVEHSLRENAAPLKEYLLGVDVFGRADSFDPATDTIVRVQARRLRSKLAEYYKSEGRDDPIVIELPKGRYLAEFRPVPVAEHRTLPYLVHEAAPVRPPLPIPYTPLLGREKELAAVKEMLLSSHVRLLTLTGAGGSGKTRLALQVAAEIRDEFPGGVYFAALAAITDPAMVASSIAQILRVRYTGGRPLDVVLKEFVSLSVYAPALLFLDNFEHLLAAGPLLVALLESCPTLKVFVTSRAVLHVSGEYEYAVPPLPVPDPKRLPPMAELLRNPAVALFAQRAAAVNPEFAVREDNAQTVVEVCARLDGLPLAIELAAARVKILSMAAMLERLHSSLGFLTGGPRDWPVRQQTLRSTIDWSYSLLNAAERKLFRRLAVFAGGCSLESAEAVCNTRQDLEAGLLEVISSVVDKSLLQRLEPEGDDVRFVMLETLREYGLERLEEAGEVDSTSRAHAAYCIVLAEETAASASEADRQRCLTQCDLEQDNLRAALDSLIEAGTAEWALRLSTALYAYWERREHLAEGRARLEAVLKLPGAAPRTKQRARALLYTGNLANQQGDFAAAVRIHKEGLAICSELGDRKAATAHLIGIGGSIQLLGDLAGARPWLEQYVEAAKETGSRAETAAGLSNLGVLVAEQGDYALARSQFEEALSIFRELGDTSGIGWSLNHLGDVARLQGQFAGARELYQQGMEAFLSSGDRWGQGRSFVDLGCLASDERDYGAAYSLFANAVEIFAGLGFKRGIAKVLEELACLAVREGDLQRALRLGGAAEGLRLRVGVPLRPNERARFDGVLDPAWKGIDPAAAQAVWLAARRMPLDESIRYAIERPPSAKATSATGS